MTYALINNEIADARDFDNDEVVTGACLRCGAQVELGPIWHGKPRFWRHSDREDRAMCSEEKDEVIEILREKIRILKGEIQFLEAQHSNTTRFFEDKIRILEAENKSLLRR